ncbi:MAG: hypothetical protein AB7V27_15510 [Candidatus Binatia bacterium]
MSSAAAAVEERRGDELLDILRQNNQITDQYGQRQQRAKQEQLEDQRRHVEVPNAPAAAPVPALDTMRAYFKDGYKLETAAGNSS